MGDIGKPKRGDVGELSIAAYLMKRGFTVLSPIGDNDRYDLAVEVEGELLRIQCKVGWLDGDGCFIFNTRSTDPQGKAKHYDEDADLFMVYSIERGQIYVVDVCDAPKGSMMLRVGSADSNHPDINWAEDYEIERWSPFE